MAAIDIYIYKYIIHTKTKMEWDKKKGCKSAQQTELRAQNQSAYVEAGF